ncbi:hypothetical protein CRH09_26410 [Nocardia terpenica]|uniref:DUF998 domain-containing protein n=2 Tax=Nocardia terpenica TaxID=455432 RepID=A0A291RNN9_9NOCA|nr:hypothetical protein CRH09_26410 [Nocardia terpenica]
MTIALAAMAVWALIRLPVIDDSFDRVMQQSTGLPDVPHLVVDLLVVLSAAAMCRHVAQAWGRKRMYPVIEYTAAGAAILLGITYAPSGARGWWSDVHLYVGSAVTLLSAVAVLLTALFALRAPATADRWTLTVIVAAAACGTVAGALRAESETEGPVSTWRVVTGGLTVALFAVAALVNHYGRREK